MRNHKSFGTPDALSACDKFTVVYFEDDRMNALLVKSIFQLRPNCTLYHAPDARNALELCRHMKPNLVLVDLQLPDMSGYETLRLLRSDPATRHVPCIALSADAFPSSIKRALDNGFADYWTKPIDVRYFLDQVDRLFEEGLPVAANDCKVEPKRSCVAGAY